ncbi:MULTISPECIES: aromatic ring-hydroxylating dioxygenase subunit alpha [Actibacterium]|uniref:Phenylpropionate dioxygenase-like ring-hydroxylating dioxygenase large terminal subunit n=1 Tax=Actibacterium naphthalenivorans TaxID=1614693 RepID=A0A840CAH9_9RHOB|nr:MULTISPECIES: aromatic ring-hydroxylating dioxygenase subunit alpha [Actibacterium]ALG89323.1 hypothetical protein TQ29_02940 [Actibacterium sp. EMB200-NS6]MBB4021072.1 phenylpropionate dioxygenase-like ring-hydroxylating dioxygenase large terminal subunit [Actibacterium naphthalenivorans]
MYVSEIPTLRDYWYPVAYSADLTDAPRPVRLLNDVYVIWRATGGKVACAVDECPHRAARLSQGWVENGQLVCPYHGWAFDGTGACTRIPQNDPERPIPPRARTLPMLVDEKYGLVWLCVGMPRADIPTLEEAEDSGFTLIHEMMEIWDTSAPRVIDNALDISHVAWTHRNTIGDSNASQFESFEIHRDGHHLSARISYRARITEALRRNTGLTGDFTTRVTNSELVQPLMYKDVMEYENGLRHVLYKTATPVDDSHTLFCQFIARNDDPDAEKIAGIVALDRRIQAEDRKLLAGVRPEFPLDIQTEMHTRADRMTVEYRKILAELAAENSDVTPDEAWARPFLSTVKAQRSRR